MLGGGGQQQPATNPNPQQPPLTLVGFLRAELKPSPSPRELFVTSHIRHCTAVASPCCTVLSYCQDIRSKLAHFEACNAPACMKCASARLAYLTCRGLISQSLIERFVVSQTVLMRSTMVVGEATPAPAPAAAEYLAKKQEFVAVLIELHQVWRIRHELARGVSVTPTTCKGHHIDALLKRAPQAAKQVALAWDHLRDSKRARPSSPTPPPISLPEEAPGTPAPPVN